MRGLEIRDLEILRALLRVRYLTTRQINRAFFSCPRVGRRRIQRLSENDLIRPHAKGLPEILRYTAWRLTTRGLGMLVDEFPTESVPDGVVNRVATGSLHHAQHREAIADLYLDLCVPARQASGRQWATEMRARASPIQWQADGDVVLRTDYLGQRTEVVPDAAVWSAERKRRVFVELDRSTKDLGRVREGLQRYMRIFASGDFGADAVTVLFVVRSAARKSNIQALGPGTFNLVALEAPEAVEWLREEVLGIEPAAPVPDLRDIAKRVYTWNRLLDQKMRANGMREMLRVKDPQFIDDGEERLLALYRSLKS